MTKENKKAEAYRLLAQAFTMLADAEQSTGTPAAPDELLNATTCGLERQTVTRLIREGHLRAARLGRSLYFRRSDLLALVDSPAVQVKAREPTLEEAAKHAYARLVEQARNPPRRQLAALERERRKRAQREPR